MFLKFAVYGKTERDICTLIRELILCTAEVPVLVYHSENTAGSHFIVIIVCLHNKAFGIDYALVVFLIEFFKPFFSCRKKIIILCFKSFGINKTASVIRVAVKEHRRIIKSEHSDICSLDLIADIWFSVFIDRVSFDVILY
ncbi:MAG: hypothetical protein BWZ04_02779 [Firmicutes bacterium ADurb.BinA205]|nr:MAG: hypothetical protein BWZ04_02779 [Firmicutes bacterium ADurb.BinA205]